MSPDALPRRTPTPSPSAETGPLYNSPHAPELSDPLAPPPQVDYKMGTGRIDVSTSVTQFDFSPERQVHQVVAAARHARDGGFFMQLIEGGIPATLEEPLMDHFARAREAGTEDKAMEIWGYLEGAARPRFDAIVQETAPRSVLRTIALSHTHNGMTANNLKGQEYIMPKDRVVVSAAERAREAQEDASAILAVSARVERGKAAASTTAPTPVESGQATLTYDGDTPTVEIKDRGHVVAIAGEPRHRRGPGHRADGKQSYFEAKRATASAPANRTDSSDVRSHRPGRHRMQPRLAIGTHLRKLRNKLPF